MNNKVIKVLTAEHGKQVIEFWKSQGINTRGFSGFRNMIDNYTRIYYGFVDGVFDSYSLDYVINGKAEIIELPSKTESPNIPQSKEELLECIQNLMGVLDTPNGRNKLRGDFIDEVRKIGRVILASNGKSIYTQ